MLLSPVTLLTMMRVSLELLAIREAAPSSVRSTFRYAELEDRSSVDALSARWTSEKYAVPLTGTVGPAVTLLLG